MRRESLGIKLIRSRRVAINVVIAITALAVCLCCLFYIVLKSTKHIASADTLQFDGEGTEVDPYLVQDAQDMLLIAANVNNGVSNGYDGKYFKLVNDIDMTEVSLSVSVAKGWSPIGTDTYPFKGNFLGNGHTIFGVNINRGDEDYIGLFGVTSESSSVNDLTLYGSIVGKNFLGGIVGYNKGEIIGCINNADISDVAGKNAMHIGGITGYNKGRIENCCNLQSIVSRSYKSGGIAGSNDGGQVIACFNKGVIDGNNIVGGIVGANESHGIISEVFNNGDISAESYAGGIVGDNKNVLVNAYNHSILLGKSGLSNMFGGIVGNNDSDASVANVYFSSTIECYGLTGAICAYNFGDIKYAYYNKDIFIGEITNGIPAVETFGRTSWEMLNGDSLEKSDKLEGLFQDMGQGKWMKREYSQDYCYYPELIIFGDSESDFFNDSIDSVASYRVELSADDIVLGQTEFIYNGDIPDPNIYWNDLLIVNNMDYIIVKSDINANDDADLCMTIEFKNYFKGEATKYFKIKKSPLSVVWSDEVFFYNGFEQYQKVSIVDGRIGEENVIFDYIFTGCVNVGEYSVKAQLADNEVNANYYFQPQTITFSIQPQPLEVLWTECKFVYNGQVQHPLLSIVSGRIGLEEILFDYYYEDCINAKEQTICVRLASTRVNANYRLSEQTVIFNIEKQPITIVWDDEELVYNGTPQCPKANIVDGIVGEEIICLDYSGYQNNINATQGSDYFVSIGLADTFINANYLFLGDTKFYGISKRVIEIEWYEQDLIYNGQAQRPQFFIAGDAQVEGELILFDISDYSSNIYVNNDFTYYINVSLKDNAVNSNYQFESQTKYYNIVQKQIVVAWEDELVEYNGKVQRPNAVITTEIYDDVNLSYSNFSGKNVGIDYYIEIDCDNDNYVIVNNLTYDIAPKNLVACWNDDILFYNGLAQRPQVELRGAIEGEMPVFAVSDFSDNIAPKIDQSKYSIEVSLVKGIDTNLNYSIKDGQIHSYDIYPKKVSVVGVNVKDRAYDGTKKVALQDGELVGIILDDDVDLLLGEGLLLNADFGMSKAVETNICLIGSDAYKYELIQPQLSVGISRAVVDVSNVLFVSTTLTFNECEQSIFVGGQVPDEIDRIEYENNGQVQVGEYIVTAKFILKDSFNYFPIENMSAILSISPNIFFDDKNDNVTLSIDSGYVSYGAKLSVEDLDENNLKSIVADNKYLCGFDIKFIDSEKEISPNGKLKVEVQLSHKQSKFKNITVYLIDTIGNVQKVDCDVDGDILSFYTDSTCQFIVLADEDLTWVAYVVICILIIVASSVVYAKKKIQSVTVTQEITITRPPLIITSQNEEELAVASLEIVAEENPANNSDSPFVFDGIECASFDSFLESLKYKNIARQKCVCALPSKKAIKNAITKHPEKKGVVYWKGAHIKLNSMQHQELVNRAMKIYKENKNERA